MAKEGERRDLPGWTWRGGKLEPLATAAGLQARGAVVTGRCNTSECRRKVQIDLADWTRHGYGAADLTTLRRAYRCGRIGCDFSLAVPVYPAGVPVQYFVGGAERFEIKCAGCGVGRLYTGAEVIAALERAGTGSGNSGVLIVGKLIRGACKACGRCDWAMEVRRPPAIGTPEFARAAKAL